MLAQAKDRVLLVDDEPQILIALEDLLSEKYTVLTSTSGEEALALLRKERDIAALVTDQRMPTMNGDELLSHLEEDDDLGRIMLTGYADLSAVVRAVNDGKLFAYVTKPWDPIDLRHKVHLAVERCRLARQLTAERRLLHDLMENIPDGIYFKDRDLRFVRANPSLARQLGVRHPDLLIGSRIEEVVSDQIFPESTLEFNVIEHGASITDHIAEVQRGSERRWISETRAPIRASDGAVIGLVGISRDVTDRIRAQVALREQTDLLNCVLDSMGEAVVVADSTGRFVIFNQQAERLLGSPGGGVSALDWTQFFHLYQADGLTPLSRSSDPLTAAIERGAVSQSEVCARRADGAMATLEVASGPLKDPQGMISGGVILLRDVTEQRVLQQMLTQSQKMEAIGRLAGGVAHDFNNLLVVIQSYSEFIFASLTPDDERRSDVEQVIEASHRAAALTKQLLAFSRHEVIAPRAVALNEVVAAIEKMLSRIIGAHIELATSLDPNLGRVLADPGQVEQVILNLTVNARDAMPNGGRLTLTTSNVRLGAAESRYPNAPPGDYVRLQAIDTGTGMSAETQRRIFEPFFTTKERDKGTGLGLATVYGIVKQNAGHIAVHSEVGHGTTFDLLFPLLTGETEESTGSEGSRTYAAASGTILVIDDNDAVREVTARVLSQEGYRVLNGRGADDARRIMAIEGGRIDLLLVDVVMPGINGPQLVQELAPIYPRMRVVYMSGYSHDAPGLARSLEQGCELIEKPFTPDTLAQRIRDALRKK